MFPWALVKKNARTAKRSKARIGPWLSPVMPTSMAAVRTQL